MENIERGIKRLRRLTKAVSYFAIVALFIIALSVSVFLRWSFDSEKVLEIKNSPFPTRFVESEDGSVVVLTTDYCKYKNIKGRLRISFVSTGREIFLPMTEEPTPVVCEKREVPILIPYDLPGDTYKIKFRATYDINPLKKDVPVEFESREFFIASNQTDVGPRGPQGIQGVQGVQGEPGTQ